MAQVDLFDNINPIDYRYYGRNRAQPELAKYFSENARIKYQLKVELELVRTLAKAGICSDKVAEEVGKAVEKVTAEEVYAEEDRIKHDVRALANMIREKVSDEAKQFVHFGSTSYDRVDPSNALRAKDAVQKILVPKLKEFEEILIDLALREKATVQIGRTHGQHAVPITFGFAIAEYVSRLGNRIKSIEDAAENLTGKFSGATGTYNATSLILDDPIEFEKELITSLGLKVSVSSNQIVEPESMLDLFHAITSCFGVLANYSDDMRHLQRSEINEIAEAFGKDQVGSSTMPHKRNPINFENVKSFWKVYAPRMITNYMDQISEHQRDLTNSASARFNPETIIALYLSAQRLIRISKNLVVDTESMQKKFEKNKKFIAAEPLYILLAKYNHPDAHEVVRQMTLEMQKKDTDLVGLINADPGLKEYFAKFSEEEKAIISNPENYLGKAVEKTENICSHWKKELQL